MYVGLHEVTVATMTRGVGREGESRKKIARAWQRRFKGWGAYTNLERYIVFLRSGRCLGFH